jgi:hypothetical protein
MHPLGCPCCIPRAPVGKALAGLFLARARGEVTFFQEVVVVLSSDKGRAAVMAAIAEDPLVSVWFRLES